MKEGSDPRDAAIRFMARESFPASYDAEHPTLGLNSDGYDRIVQYYDVGQALSRQFVQKQIGLTQFIDHKGNLVYDYSYDSLTQGDNLSPTGRGLGVGMPDWQRALLKVIRRGLSLANPLISIFERRYPALRELRLLDSFGIDLSHGVGPIMVDRLAGVFQSLGGVIRADNGVDALLVSLESQVAEGVRTVKGDLISAKRGVVFATGGFGHNRELLTMSVDRAMKPVFRAGAAAGSTGDFHQICDKLGVELEMMDAIWGCETHYVEEKDGVPVPWEVESCLFQLRGDSCFVVAGDGKRVYDEKLPYDDRAKVHFIRPQLNKVLFMIGDQRVVDLFGSDLCVSWPKDESNPLYISAPTILLLGQAIRERYPLFVSGLLLTFTKQRC